MMVLKVFKLGVILSLAVLSAPTRGSADVDDGALPASENRQWLEMLQHQIQPGLRRADVEKLLPHRDDGPQSLAMTRYRQDADSVVVVPYDQTGGQWSDENRVTGLIHVYSLSH